jgi:purine-nucleoside phosphorylase
LILGSGLNSLADEIANAEVIPFRDIPGFPVSTVEGHSSALVIGALNGKAVIAMRGRVHYYEGYSMQRITLPVRAMRALGVETLIVTNAAGGVNVNFHAGDLMLITDHINLVGMTGLNPLRGANDDSLGPRFPDMTHAYDPGLRELARQVARDAQIELREGVYIMLAGPSFESPADVNFIRLIGADAVGMSTVPEVIVARHGGMRVLGISLISNSLAHAHFEVNHQEVLAAGKAAMPKLAGLITGVLARI